MYGKKCLNDLSATGVTCGNCGRAFDRTDPRTYRGSPLPGPWGILGHVLLTTVLAIGVAFVVAFHQLARTSNH